MCVLHNTLLVCPTLNPGQLMEEWINAIMMQSLQLGQVLIVDSGSTDDSVQKAADAGFRVMQINQFDFNHGSTRQSAINDSSDFDLVVFLTQDAILSGVDSLNKILEPFRDEDVAAVCGRQLPRKMAGAIEAHARLYNYSAKSFIRSINDVSEFGLKAAFISNSFAAYRVSMLNEVGGFPNDVIFGEDMYVAAKLLMSGYKIAYEADACVYHSHNYSLFQEFSRYFDMGIFHAKEPWIMQEFGTAESEGLKFVISEIKYLSRHAFWRIPEGMLRTLFRYTGFRLGMMEKMLPLWLKRVLVMNKGYYK